MGYKVAVIWDGEREGTSWQAAQAVSQACAQAGHEPHMLQATDALTHNLRVLAPDVAFPCTLQGQPDALASLLELMRIPFVGTPARMARLASDRASLPAALRVAAQADPVEATAPFTVTLASAAITSLGALDALDLIESAMPAGFPVCVRSAHASQGSGVAFARDEQQLAAALTAAAQVDSHVMVQQWVDGPHISVCVVGDGGDLGVLPAIAVSAQEASDIVRPDSAHAALAAPAPLELFSQDKDEAQAARSQVERDALDAFLACGARDLARVDLIWDGARSQVIEVCLRPSLAPGSVLASATALAELSPDELVDELVDTAVMRGC